MPTITRRHASSPRDVERQILGSGTLHRYAGARRLYRLLLGDHRERSARRRPACRRWARASPGQALYLAAVFNAVRRSAETRTIYLRKQGQSPKSLIVVAVKLLHPLRHDQASSTLQPLTSPSNISTRREETSPVASRRVGTASRPRRFPRACAWRRRPVPNTRRRKTPLDSCRGVERSPSRARGILLPRAPRARKTFSGRKA